MLRLCSGLRLGATTFAQPSLLVRLQAADAVGVIFINDTDLVTMLNVFFCIKIHLGCNSRGFININ